MTDFSTIRPPTLEEVIAWQRKPRKRLRRIGRKGLREREALARFRHDVAERAGGMCEARGERYSVLICRPHEHYGTQAHHIWPEDRDKGVHDPERGLWLCWDAHRYVHEHPDEAKLLGLLRAVKS